MCFRLRFAGLISLFFAIAAYGQERVAIIQTVDDLDSIGISELAYLTDRLRETAVNVLPKQRYGVMTTESIIAFLGTQERAAKECKEANCLAELGRKVNAAYVAQARVGRFGGNLTIKTELYNSQSGNLVGSFIGDAKDIFGLLAIIDEKAKDLFKKMPGVETEINAETKCEEKKEPERRMRFGARVNFGMFGEFDNLNKDPSVGIGAFTLIPFYGKYLVPEISLQSRSKGGTISVTQENGTQINEEADIIKEVAIQIPILIRFRYREENMIHTGFGPFFGVALSIEDKLNGAYKDNRSRIEYGILLELGAHIFRSYDLPIDLRLGVIDTAKDKVSFGFVMQLGASYVF